jgi:hypothetical protein
VHSAPRANTLHNFLADVTAFGEIQRSFLVCFLRQVTLTYVLPITRDTGCNAEQLNCCRAYRFGAGIGKRLPQSLGVIGRTPQFIRFNQRTIAAHHSHTDLLPADFGEVKCLQLRKLKPGGFQELSGARPGDPDGSQFVADIFGFDFVHDDVLTKN